MAKLLRKLLCALNRHRQLDIIQSFRGSEVQHIGCPDCGRQYAMHHGLRVCLPWDDELARMYRLFGRDVDGPLAAWQAYRASLQQSGGQP